MLELTEAAAIRVVEIRNTTKELHPIDVEQVAEAAVSAAIIAVERAMSCPKVGYDSWETLNAAKEAANTAAWDAAWEAAWNVVWNAAEFTG